MRIAVFGKHPIPQPGFEGVMSLYEASWLSRFGHEVDLFIPFRSKSDLVSLQTRHSLSDLDSLTKLSGSFAIRPLFSGETPTETGYDFGIWQSYTLWEWDEFSPWFKRACRHISKNFPKFVPSPDYRADTFVVNQFLAFDLLAIALKDDVETLQEDEEFFSRNKHKVCYVPRGADPVMLSDSEMAPVPTVGMDAPVGADPRATRHIVESLQRVRTEIPDLSVLSIRQPQPALNAQVISHCDFQQFYRQFMNPIWIYMIINYEYSPAHITAGVQQKNLAWRRKGIYEVQNVEAQMSGACLIGHADNMIDELYVKDETGFNFSDFDDIDGIANVVMDAIRNHQEISRRCRSFAVENFSWEECMRRWELGMLEFLQ